MVNNQSEALDATFAALADPTRRAILKRLAQGERTVGELARPFEISPPAISRHLRVLEAARLLKRERQGRVHRIQLNPDPLKRASAWIQRQESFWRDRFDALERYLDEVPSTPSKQKGVPRGRR